MGKMSYAKCNKCGHRGKGVVRMPMEYVGGVGYVERALCQNVSACLLRQMKKQDRERKQ